MANGKSKNSDLEFRILETHFLNQPFFINHLLPKKDINVSLSKLHKHLKYKNCQYL